MNERLRFIDYISILYLHVALFSGPILVIYMDAPPALYAATPIILWSIFHTSFIASLIIDFVWLPLRFLVWLWPRTSETNLFPMTQIYFEYKPSDKEDKRSKLYILALRYLIWPTLASILAALIYDNLM